MTEPTKFEEQYELEFTKFTANWIDRLSTACMITGVLTPLATQNGIKLILPADDTILGSWGLWLFAGIAIHLIGHLALARLLK